MASSSSSKFLTYGLKYHVFISFRGKDTRMGFARNLYDALHRNQIKVFFDEEELEKGEEINPALDKAIKESLMALVIFSTNYASSSWCLEELAKVMEYSKDKVKRMLVLPIFYDVNPSDMRYNKGSYGEAFAKHEGRCIKKWKIERWKLALQNAAYVSGWHIKPGQMNEHEFIHNIVEYVSQRISSLRDGDKSIDQHFTRHSDEKTESLLLPGIEDRIVVYCTSFRGVRKTYIDCNAVRILLNSFRVEVDERDINLNASYKKELQNALGSINAVTLPQVFIGGMYIGNADVIKELYESGVLAKLLKDFPIIRYSKYHCSVCRDLRFVSCLMSQYCNESGMIRCPSCCS